MSHSSQNGSGSQSSSQIDHNSQSGRNSPARRIAFYALATAAACVLSGLESMIPLPTPAPGIKLGLANTVTLILLLGGRNPAYAAAVTAMRCILAALLFGALSSLVFSLAGGLASCLVMWALLRLGNAFSPIGASVAGALTHNMSQLAAASLIARDLAIFGYMPVLLAAGAAAGIATGYVALKANSIICLINNR